MTDMYPDVQVTPGPTSYFSDRESRLDPFLFDGDTMREEIRLELTSMLVGHLMGRFTGVGAWLRAWVAGSAVSYQWSSSPGLGDLDVLVGIDFETLRSLNPTWAGLSDTEVAKIINEGFYEQLTPLTTAWRDAYEVTFYVNPDSYDIRAINPYAAYDILNDEWAVRPSSEGPPENKYWAEVSKRDHEKTQSIVSRYTTALTALRSATNPAGRVNAERALNHTIDQGIALFDSIHQGRRSAFSRVGAGYADWGNYRWQAGKGSGAVPALRALKNYRDESTKSNQAQTYGLELPSTDTLVRRAVARRAQQ